jgi:hypothetical protein
MGGRQAGDEHRDLAAAPEPQLHHHRRQGAERDACTTPKMRQVDEIEGGRAVQQHAHDDQIPARSAACRRMSARD